MSINIECKCENCFHKGVCNHQKTYTIYHSSSGYCPNGI